MAGEIILSGALVERSPAGANTWATIPGVTSLGFPEEQVDYQEITNLDSPGGYREYISGLIDAGEASMEQVYTRDAYAQLEADRGVLMDYRITLKSPDGGVTTGDVHSFSAIRTGAFVTDDVGAPVRIANTLRISGQPGFVAGS